MRIEGGTTRTSYLPSRDQKRFSGDALANLSLKPGLEIKVYPATPEGSPYRARVISLNGKPGDPASRNAIVTIGMTPDGNPIKHALGGGTTCEIISPIYRR